jgi:hypothetical protein
VVEVQGAGERPRRLFAEVFERLLALIDEGRAEHREPDSLSRATAEGVSMSPPLSSNRSQPQAPLATRQASLFSKYS